MLEMATLHDVALAALLEITDESAIGAPAGQTDEGDGVVSVLFDSAMPGYPGWKWTVSIAQLADTEPSVLEVELMPAEGALLSPDWVPWSDRLAEYNAAQAAEVSEASESEDSDDDSDSDDDDDDDSDDDPDDDDDDSDDDSDDEDDDLGSDVLHGGDLDGVDIDDLDEALGESGDDDDSDDDDDDDDEGDDRAY
jgi:hypothetical protein